MMYYKPSVKINKVVVYRDDNIAYQQAFTSGINVIRGENSSGKSSVLNFIFFGLGGDFNGWTKEASLCDWVYLYLCINGEEELIIRRRVENKRQQPMEIYFGEIGHDESGQEILNSSSWKRFPFRRSASSPSFSQVLFQMLGMPEVRGEASSNITMHQLLRLVYAEQSNIPQKIFRFEQHDTPLIRQTVGSFLEGAYNDDLYNYILEKNNKEKEFEVIDAQLRSFYKMFGASAGDLTLAALEKQETEWTEKADTLQKEIREIGVHGVPSEEGPKGVEELRNDLKSTNLEFENLSRKLRSLDFEIEDSDQFVSELEERLDFLNESNDAASIFKNIRFEHCPACFSELEKVPEGCCAICGKEEDPNSASLLRMRNEIYMQIKESKALQEMRVKERERVISQLEVTEQRKKSLEVNYNSLVDGWVSDRDLALNRKYSELGYSIKAIEDIGEKKKMSGVLNRLQHNKAELAALISELKDTIHRIEAHDLLVKANVQKQIKNSLIELLQADLPRQDSFISVEEIDYSYQDNSIRVNDVDYFSASSMVFLNKCFRLALFWSSGKLEKMRFPRLLLLDGIEDGGIEPERAHNLQRLVRHVSEDMDVDHQIIMATSVLDEDLDKPDYVRGEFYTHDKRSLSFH